ncbi:GlyGly-CTERM sorting domain-containing protein [Rhizobium rhizogenes]|uniref:GlyGly-CTERM sorting domain-containing protein n=1 Tax=Rhizobium rhizogenes TaxID=359 RepID=A0A546XQW4_RHIRH|nr:GlyGly-CTERM sorting domain-containing protein [Rhizobium rhizogenes]
MISISSLAHSWWSLLALGSMSGTRKASRRASR